MSFRRGTRRNPYRATFYPEFESFLISLRSILPRNTHHAIRTTQYVPLSNWVNHSIYRYLVFVPCLYPFFSGVRIPEFQHFRNQNYWGRTAPDNPRRGPVVRIVPAAGGAAGEVSIAVPRAAPQHPNICSTQILFCPFTFLNVIRVRFAPFGRTSLPYVPATIEHLIRTNPARVKSH
jgi:hypothetical protein